MPTVADVTEGTRPAQIETLSSSTMHSRYPSASDGGADPAEGFFDSAADAQTVLTARQGWFGSEVRRFQVIGVQGLQWPASPPAILRLALTDVEEGLSAAPTITARIEVDLETETTSYEVFG